MPLAAGQTLTHYEILGLLGAGAMGEVYRARDTRLQREIAIKVLPDELASDEQRLRRFEREARTLASLSHANLAHVYGIDQVGDTCFIAMELVPGEDLAARLARGPLSLADTLDVCHQVAEGLEAAHEAGVVHRDLKPANVCVTPDGKVKLLDFGLAKAAVAGSGSGSGASDAASVLETALSTEPGRVVGTPTYMAPEQARGKPVDKRVDVWAFGCVLFECLAGRRPFGGETVSDVVAALLEREPDWSALPGSTPPGLRRLVERCLRKDPRQRLRDIGDARIELEEVAASGGAPESAPPPARRHLPVLAVVVAVLLVSAGVWGSRWLASGEPGRAAISSTPITASQFYDQDPSWSPEGEWIAFSRQTSGSHDLYLKNVSTGDEILRRGGPGDEVGPRWSPDGRYIAVVATDLPGTPVLLVRPHSPGTSGERELIDTQVGVFDIGLQQNIMGSRPWKDDGSSLLVSRVTDGDRIAVFHVGRDDGELRQLTFPPVGSDDLAASYSFDQRNIVFVRETHDRGVLMLMPATGGEPEVLLDDGFSARRPSWRPDGRRVVYLSERGASSDLWEIDVEMRTSRQLTFLTDVFSGLSVCTDGRIAYPREWHDTILTTLDLETGGTISLTSHAADNYGPRFSPDGREIAYHSTRTGDSEIWVLAEDGSERQITHGAGQDVFPDWSPDGERLLFNSNRDGATKLYTSDRDGGDCHLLWNRALSHPESSRWSPAGELIGCIVLEEVGNVLWGVPTDGTGEARRLLEGVESFDWYLDGRRILCKLVEGRSEKLVAVHLESGEMRTLWTGPLRELDVSFDGSSVMFVTGPGHLAMGLATLELVPPADADGLPTARGEPVDIVRLDGAWHVHHGGWAPEGRRVAYVHDADRADIYVLEETR
ncbi:MAG: protein kinase domain-containing protein [Planctomycetota bacterium]|jgi:serine/threonine protein kinase